MSLLNDSLKKQLIESFYTEASPNFIESEGQEIIKVTGSADLFCICPGVEFSLPELFRPNQHWEGDDLYIEGIHFVGNLVWDLAQNVNKNKFVFKMKSEGFTFHEMKFWSDIFHYICHRYLDGCPIIEKDAGMHFTQIWACAPHSINLKYVNQIHKEYNLFEGMSIICSNNFEVLTASEYTQGDLIEQESIKELNSAPTIKPYKFLFYNNHAKFNRTYNVGQIVRRELHPYGLMSINLGHNLPDDEARKELFNYVVTQYTEEDNPQVQEYYPKTGQEVFQALQNNKELVQSLKPLGKPRWISDDSARFDSYMALGKDTKEHCEKCYFAIVTETKFFHDRVENNGKYSYPVTSDTLYLDCITFTEKTHKFHLAKMPFILCGMPGSLKVLREQGYKTFSPFINETYDLIENDEERSVAIADEITRLCQQTDEWWYETLVELQPRLDHNFNHLVDNNRNQSLRFSVS